jgi:hypothetical protein
MTGDRRTTLLIRPDGAGYVAFAPKRPDRAGLDKPSPAGPVRPVRALKPASPMLPA